MKTRETEDEAWEQYQAMEAEIYDEVYYRGNTLVSYVNNAGHRLAEALVPSAHSFAKVLEVGAGTGVHFEFVKHRFGSYYLTDISEDRLRIARARHGGRLGLRFDIADATALKYDDDSFDRLISIYNLEHLPHPHRVLREWRRVVRPGGLISVAIPLDGGVAWRLGRHLTTRRAFARKGIDLGYVIAREHINPSYNLIALIRHYFPLVRERYFPFRIPMIDPNLVYVAQVTVADK